VEEVVGRLIGALAANENFGLRGIDDGGGQFIERRSGAPDLIFFAGGCVHDGEEGTIAFGACSG